MPEVKQFGMVSFREITKAGAFYDQIWSGRKRLTMREPRSDGRPHVKVGYAFPIYWRVRTPRDRKPVHYIGLAMCERYELISLADVWDDEEHAKKDGVSGSRGVQRFLGLPN